MPSYFVVEKRDTSGRLDFADPQPPHEWVHGVDEDTMADWWFRDHPQAGNTAPSMANIYAEWYHRFGWWVRPKTW